MLYPNPSTVHASRVAKKTHEDFRFEWYAHPTNRGRTVRAEASWANMHDEPSEFPLERLREFTYFGLPLSIAQLYFIMAYIAMWEVMYDNITSPDSPNVDQVARRIFEENCSKNIFHGSARWDNMNEHDRLFYRTFVVNVIKDIYES